jgi:hypothetical protein
MHEATQEYALKGLSHADSVSSIQETFDAYVAQFGGRHG